LVEPQRSRLMKRVRRFGTEPEVTVRKILAGLGARYRINVVGLPGTPDLANKRMKKAIFVHGCFWHAHSHCKRHCVPKVSRAFWEAKFAANVERDARKVKHLEDLGFAVTVVWQCELDEPDILAKRLAAFWWAGRTHSDPPPCAPPPAPAP